MALTISIGYTRSGRERLSTDDYIPSIDGYQIGAAQDIVTLELPPDSPAGQLPIHELAETVFVATNAPYPSFMNGTPGAHEIADALSRLTNPSPTQRLGLRSLSAGDTVTANGRTVACLPVGFAEVPGYRPPGQSTARTPERAEFLTRLIITGVEGRLHIWANIIDYRWYLPPKEGGALPGPGGNANASLTMQEPENLGRGRVFIIGPDAIEDTLERISARPVENMSEQRRRHISSMLHRDPGTRANLNADDADEVIQIACFGRGVF